MATAYKKPTAAPAAPAPADDSMPLVDMIAIHDYHYGRGKNAAPGTVFRAPLTEVDWLLENGVASLVSK